MLHSVRYRIGVSEGPETFAGDETEKNACGALWLTCWQDCEYVRTTWSISCIGRVELVS